MAAQHIGSVATSNTAGTFPEQSRRKYDRSDVVIIKEHANAPLLALLTDKLAKDQVKDPEFRGFEIDYDIHEGLISHASALSTSVTSLTCTDLGASINADAFLLPGDLLHVPSAQTNQTNASADIAGENMVVISVSGSTIIVQRRNGVGTNAANVTATTTTLRFYREGNRNPEGWSAGEARNTAMEYELNYIQNFSETFEATEDVEATDLYGPASEYEFRANETRRNFMVRLERALIAGQRYKTTAADKPVRQMGGVTWFITNLVNMDSAAPITTYVSWTAATDLVEGTAAQRSRIWKITSISDPTKWSTKKWNILGEQIFNANGSNEKWVMMGSGMYTEFNELFDKYLRTPMQQTSFGLKYKQFIVGGGTFNIVWNPIMDWTGYSLWAIGLDLKFLKRVHLQGYDVQRKNDIQAKADHSRKGEYFGRLSLKMNNWGSHFIAYISDRS